MSETPKIPKIVHQIWLGPKLPPPYFLTFQEKWKALHPDWEFRLWTDSDLDKLDLELRDLIDLSPNWAEKSDILRAELLDKFGGLYIDVDMECNHSLTELNHKYDFYIGLEYPHKIATTNNRIWAGISIMASCPKHPIMKRWKEYIRKRWDAVNEAYTSPVEKVINHTYFPFSFSVLEKLNDGNYTNIAFPATYFYPLTCTSAAKRRVNGIRAYREKLYEFLEDIKLKRPRAFTRIYPETLAVHYWGNNWIAGNEDQIKELQRHVSFLKKEMYFYQQRLSRLEKMYQGKAQDAAAFAKEMPVVLQPTAEAAATP
jgi:mannosyltransferase OCH1-like enzyme